MGQRMGMVIGIDADKVDAYKAEHAKVWPQVLAQLKRSNIENYSIFLREPEGLLFSYWEYAGDDFDADMKAMADDENTQKWWALCGPMQRPLDSRESGEWWAQMTEVFHLD